MFGLAEFVIIGAIAIAAMIFFSMSRTARQNTSRTLSEPHSINWDAIADAEVQANLPHRKISAIKRYRELTGVGLRDGKEAIEYVIANPDAAKKGKSGSGDVVDTDGAGVKDLIAEGRLEEAVDVYAAFMGVDKFTAKDAVYKMQREESAVYNLSNESMDEVRRLVAEGKKINAIKLYREMTNLGLKDAKDEIDRIEREGY